MTRRPSGSQGTHPTLLMTAWPFLTPGVARCEEANNPLVMQEDPRGEETISPQAVGFHGLGQTMTRKLVQVLEMVDNSYGCLPTSSRIPWHKVRLTLGVQEPAHRP